MDITMSVPCSESEVIIARMFRSILCLMILCTGTIYGAVKHVPIRSRVVLKPGEAYTAQIASEKPVEIGWTAVQTKPCATDCVQMTLMSGNWHTPLTTALGAAGKFTPSDGKIAVEYKNVSQEPVTIDVFRVERTCEAAACKLFDNSKKSSWLVFKVAEFKSITNSADGSYSKISGVVQSGRAFRIRAVWWTDEKGVGFMSCPLFIKKYVDNHTPKEQYSPYILSGQNAGDANTIVLKSVDDCVPHAPNFGVPEKNVFK